MTHNYFDRVATIPAHIQKDKLLIRLFQKTFRNKKIQILATVFGIFTLITTGMLVVNDTNTSKNAFANSSFISSTPATGIIATMDSLLPSGITKNSGDTIELALNLQNTGTKDTLTEIVIDIYNTKDTVKWNTATLKKNSIGSSDGHSFVLPNLASSEKAKYILKGTVGNNDAKNIAIMTRVKYTTNDSAKEITSNRVFVSLDNSIKIEQDASLKINKLEYKSAEKLLFTVAKPTNVQEEWPGQITINDKNTGNIVATARCEILAKELECKGEMLNLVSGKYSAVFMINDMQKSNTIEFAVNGVDTNNAVEVFKKFKVGR